MSSHRPYIDAVGAAVAGRGVPIVTAIATRIAGRSEALLRLDGRATATFADASCVDLRWDEERGWRCVVAYPLQTSQADVTVTLDGDAMPQPAAVASWVADLLTAEAHAAGGTADATPQHPAEDTPAPQPAARTQAPATAPADQDAQPAGAGATPRTGTGAGRQATEAPAAAYAEVAA